jgi:type IV pilus assembly protein PilX
MLLLLTIIGLTGVQVTSLEEKMAGNSKDQNLAFQAAEAAIRAGEANIASVVAIAAFNGSNGLYGIGNATNNYATSNAWTSGGSVQFNSGFSVNNQPRYFVKHIATVEDTSSGGDLNIGNAGGNTAGAKISYFTITARGTGGRDSSQVFLQTYYGKRF